MKTHEFIKRYASLPLDKRGTILNSTKFGLMTMFGVYRKIMDLGDKIRPFAIKQEKLLEIADEYLSLLEESND